MGFFSDLKDDLSQAVNELLPEEEQNAAEENPDENAISLDEMLQNIDAVELSEMEEKESVAEDAVEEVVEEAAQDDVIAAIMEELNSPAEEEKSDDMDIESMLENVLSSNDVPDETNERESKGVEKEMDSNVSRTVSDETAVITAGMTITGDIESEGSVDIIGCVNGNIDVLGKLNVTGHINGNSKAAEIYAEGAKINGEVISEGAVKIGASSVVIGDIIATSAAIAGAVKGDIDVKGPVILDASAIVMGNIKSKSVQINNGAVIEGMCSQCYADVSPTSFFEDYKPENKKAKQK